MSETINKFENWLIVIHHTAWWTLDSINNSHKKRFFDEQKLKQALWKINWEITKYPYIAYHFLIDKWVIYRNRDLNQVWYHAWNWNVNCNSIAISVNWNFENEEITEQDLNCIKEILKELWEKIEIKEIKWHRDIKATLCPWKNLYKKLDELREFVFKKEEKQWKYEKIFNDEFWWKSSIYYDLNSIINNIKIDKEDLYIILIWQERLYQEIKKTI